MSLSTRELRNNPTTVSHATHTSSLLPNRLISHFSLDGINDSRCARRSSFQEAAPCPVVPMSDRQAYNISARTSTIGIVENTYVAPKKLTTTLDDETAESPTIFRSRSKLVHHYDSPQPVSFRNAVSQKKTVDCVQTMNQDGDHNTRPQTSNGRTRGSHLDLFDAVSVLSKHKRNLSLSKSTGSGTREYGEDVADRNLKSLRSSGLDFYTDPKVCGYTACFKPQNEEI